jgi:hypothetical protein
MMTAVLNERKTAQLMAVKTEGKTYLDAGPPTKSEQHQMNKGSVTTFMGKRDADYLTARIARDRPDILERMKHGDYKSVRAAAIDAGIVKQQTTPHARVDTTMEPVEKQWVP